MKSVAESNMKKDFGQKKPAWVYILPEECFNNLIQKYSYFGEPDKNGIAHCALDNGHAVDVNISNGEEI
jgi:hypothetical protein